MRCAVRGLIFWLAALLPGLALGAPPAKGGREVLTLRFVAYAKERPTEEFRKMEPFRRQLESLLAERGMRVKIDLRIFSTYDEAHQAIIAGDFDFGRLGPSSYLIVRERKAPMRLLVCESYRGTARFEGALFVRDDSPIRELADIRGKRVAFGDETSTTGRYLPQAALVRAGIKAGDLAAYDYLGRHDKVVLAVFSGIYEVGAANDRAIEKYADRGLRKIAKVTTPTEPWIVHSSLDPKLAGALRSALLAVDQEALRYLDRDGFLPCDENGFAVLFNEMAFSRRFGG